MNTDSDYETLPLPSPIFASKSCPSSFEDETRAIYFLLRLTHLRKRHCAVIVPTERRSAGLSQVLRLLTSQAAESGGKDACTARSLCPAFMLVYQVIMIQQGLST